MDPTSRDMINLRPRDEELKEQDLLSRLGKPLSDDYVDMDCSLKLGPTVENLTHHLSPSPSLPQKTKGRALILADLGHNLYNSSSNNNMNGLNNIDDLSLGDCSGGGAGGGGGGGSGGGSSGGLVSASLIPSKEAEQPESGGDDFSNIGKSCAICKSIKTPRWRNYNGPYGREIICNACSNRIKREEKKAMEMERNHC